MLKKNVKIGTTYWAKVSGEVTKVRITRECDYGGWYSTNLKTGRENRIRTAARLRGEVGPAPGTRPITGPGSDPAAYRAYLEPYLDEASQIVNNIVDKTEF